MRKRFTKIICFMVVAVLLFATVIFAACSKEYDAAPLGGNIFSGEVESNGGFAVKKGEYIYFINGSEDNSANNDWGSPVRGAIMRIKATDLAEHDYSKCDTVVPLVAYSGNTNAPNYGIFIYGDYIYYSTPAVTVDSNGEVENQKLDFRRTKLDGTGTSKDPIFTYSTSTLQYTFVEDGEEGHETVYLVYVATSESLYGTSYTNLHSVNCSTGANTVLVYNVQNVIFDTKDVENPYIYYTMQVPKLGESGFESDYNQIYRVSAGATQKNKYDFTIVEDYNADSDPIYINCGDLIMDGRGKSNKFTQFNAGYVDETTEEPEINYSARTFTLSSYEDGDLFITRTSTNDDTPTLFRIKDGDITIENGKAKPLADLAEDAALQRNATQASSYNYICDGDGNITEVLVESSDGIKIKKVTKSGDYYKIPDDEGTLNPTSPEDYLITDDGTPTILNIDAENHYVYYSTASGKYNFKRINYAGKFDDYEDFKAGNESEEYDGVEILDIAADNSWYAPEFIDGQILFPTATDNMSNFTYIFAFDLRKDFGAQNAVMTNADIKAINEQFEKIDGDEGKIGEVSDANKTTTRNLASAFRYTYYTLSVDKIESIDAEFRARVEEYDDSDYTSGYNKLTIDKVKAFIKAEGEWAEFSQTRTINGVTIHSNARDYYYSLLGRMSSGDKTAYLDVLANAYLQKAPEAEVQVGFFEGLSDGAKAGFIIGVIEGAFLLIALGALIAGLVLRKKGAPEETKRRRYRVDTTDDKDIDVYADDEEQAAEGAEGESETPAEPAEGDVPAENEGEEPADEGNKEDGGEI